VAGGSRVLSGVDLALLWGDLGIGLLVLVTGALLVPALGGGQAVLVIILGSAIGAGLLALGAAVGARAGLPAMVLFRPVLGDRGSYLPSVLNVAQLVGWTAVELWAMTSVADLVAFRSFGVSARPLWLLGAASVTVALALWGPVGVTRVWMKRFGAWVLVSICAALTVLLVTSGAAGRAFAAPAHGGWPTFGAGLDLVIAMPVSWLPLVADYSRFARGTRSAFAGTFLGYGLANVWLFGLGAVLVTGAGASPTPSGMAAAILALSGGSLAGLVFLMGLLVGETDEAFADVYSGALSLRNVFPRLDQRWVVLAIVTTAVPLAAWLSMARYESFLFLLGSVFVPLFGVLGGHLLIRGERTISYESHPRRSFAWDALIAWLAGFLVYHWIAPVGPPWWTDLSRSLLGAPVMETVTWLPASIPSFLVGLLLAAIGRRAIIRGTHGAR
jgi:putative hydroxymethylpyrimidine transporter CytX